MQTIASQCKTRLLLTAGALFFFCTPAAAQNADTAQIFNRLNQLDNQVQTLSRAVYKGDQSGAAAFASAPADAAALANNETRLSDIEETQRKLTGDIEKLSYDVQQLTGRLDRMQGDIDQRFREASPAASSGAASSVIAPPPTETSGEKTLGTVSSGGSSSPADAMYEEAFAAVRNAQYDDAETGFKQFLSQYPSHTLASNAQYWLGETYYVRGQFKEAARAFAQGFQNYPKSTKADDSLYKLALSLGKLNKKDDACVSLRELEKRFSKNTGPLYDKTEAEIKRLSCP